MSKRPDPELIDAENPAWTAAEVKRAVPFTELPAALQATLRGQPQSGWDFGLPKAF